MPSKLFKELYFKSAVKECARLYSLTFMFVEFKTADYTSLVSLADSVYEAGTDFIDATIKHAALLNPKNGYPRWCVSVVEIRTVLVQACIRLLRLQWSPSVCRSVNRNHVKTSYRSLHSG